MTTSRVFFSCFAAFFAMLPDDPRSEFARSRPCTGRTVAWSLSETRVEREGAPAPSVLCLLPTNHCHAGAAPRERNARRIGLQANCSGEAAEEFGDRSPMACVALQERLAFLTRRPRPARRMGILSFRRAEPLNARIPARNRSGGFQPIELLDFVGGAETHGLAQVVAGLLRSRLIALGHAPPLREDISENPEIRTGSAR